MDLVEPFRSRAENPDPAIIFRTMEVGGAFHHAVTSYEVKDEWKYKIMLSSNLLIGHIFIYLLTCESF